MSFLIRNAWQDAFKLRDRRPIWDWANENVTLPAVLSQTSAFSVEDSLHFCEPLQALRDDRVREVNIMAPPRSGKSLIADIFIPWTIDNDPASILHVFHDDTIAKSYAETRIMPVIRSVSAITELFQSNRHATRTREIIFSNGLPYICTGPAIGKLQSRGFRVVVLDEPWLIAAKHPGRMAEAKARMGDFVRHQRNKYLCIAQGGHAGDDWDLQYSSGTIHEWEVECRSCRKQYRTDWEGKRSDGSLFGIRYDSEKDDRGRRIKSRAMETVRYECPHCGHVHLDNAIVKNYWNATGKYRATPDGTLKRKSYHWDGLIIDPWSDQVEEWVTAQDAYDEGNHEPLKIFYQKRRAQHYDPEKAERIYQLPTVEINTGEDGKHWDKQDCIFQTVDVQKDHFWVLIMAWSKDSEFMILWAGKVFSWEEVAARQKEYNVRDQCVFVDSGDGSRQAEIYYHCALNGHQSGRAWMSWFALAGADRDQGFDVVVKTRPQKVTVKKVYSWPPQKGDPIIGQRDEELKKKMRGKHCQVVRWSNLMVKGIAAVRRDELSEGNARSQMIDAEWNEEFAKQLYSERLSTFVNQQTKQRKKRWVRIGKRDNHLWDCFCMQHVAAAMAGILTAALPE